MGHDQLFKGILHRFFREFIEIFFPDLAARLDLESAEFPDAELFKGFPDGGRREPDVVGLVRTREGDPGLVLVHVEVQARTERDFDRRMYEYYSLLWLRFDVPIFPIVLYIRRESHRGLALEPTCTSSSGTRS